MNLSNSWIIATKDFNIITRKKSIIYGTIAFPMIVCILLPMVILLVLRRNPDAPIDRILPLLSAFSFFFAILAAGIPIALASYSIIGEKVEKSLEPLLTTPIKDEELLLGKIIAAFIPTLIADYIGGIIYMILINLFTHSKFGYYFYPNWTIGIVLLLLSPSVAFFSIELNVIASSLTSDVRSAQAFGIITIIPLGSIYVMSEINYISLTDTNLLLIAAIFFGLDVILFFVCRLIFRREQILTKWK
jgi:ABC-2 type transport system permease protein